jgi:queuine/archaeosine tRNA-ribosyltransferase
VALAVVPRHLLGVREPEHQERIYTLLDAGIDVRDDVFSDRFVIA